MFKGQPHVEQDEPIYRVQRLAEPSPHRHCSVCSALATTCLLASSQPLLFFCTDHFEEVIHVYATGEHRAAPLLPVGSLVVRVVVREEDGEEVSRVEALNGDLIVCRPRRTRPNRRIYHHINVDFFTAGRITPECRCSRHDTADWVLRRRRDIKRLWRGCKFDACFGSQEQDPDKASETDEDSPLAARLSQMSVEEFDRSLSVR